MGLLPPIIAELRMEAGQFTSELNKVRSETKALAEEGAGHFDKLKAAAGPALAGTGAAALATGAALEHLSGGLEKAHASLDQSIKNLNLDMADYTEGIDKTNSQMEKFGHTNADSEEALSKLTIALQDPAKAMDEMSTAADIAAMKHISLAAAADVVAKVHAGNTKILKQYGIDVAALGDPVKNLTAAQKQLAKETAAYGAVNDKLAALSAKVGDGTKMNASQLAEYNKLVAEGTSAYDAMTAAQEKVASAQDDVNTGVVKGDNALAALSERLHGQAAASADTFSGKLDYLKVRVQDIAAHFGEKLAPVLVTAGPLLMGLGAIVDSTVIPSLWGMATATAAATWEFVLVAAGIAALVAGVIYAYTHWKWFHDAIDEAWQIIQMTFDWIKDHWPLVLTILTGPIGLAVAVIVKNWDTIKDGFQTVYDFFVGITEGLYNAIKGPFEMAFNWVKAVYDKTIGPIIATLRDVKGLFGGNPEQLAVDAQVKAARAAGHSDEEIKAALGDKVGAIGTFASGGFVFGPRGMPRLVIAHGGEAIGGAQGMSTQGGGGGNVYQISVTVAPGANLVDAGRQMTDAIAAYEKRAGTGWRS